MLRKEVSFSLRSAVGLVMLTESVSMIYLVRSQELSFTSEDRMNESGHDRLRGIVEEAISAEEAAYELYDRALGIVKDEQAKTVIKELRDEELLHREMLEKLDLSSWTLIPENLDEKEKEISASDFLVVGELEEGADFQDILTFAMKKEEGARDFYSGLARMAPAGDEREFFQKLAQMEEKHKKKCEALYWETYG